MTQRSAASVRDLIAELAGLEDAVRGFPTPDLTARAGLSVPSPDLVDMLSRQRDILQELHERRGQRPASFAPLWPSSSVTA